MREYTSYHCVEGEHMNFHGSLQDCWAVKWLQQMGFATVVNEFKTTHGFRFKGMMEQSFEYGIPGGTMLEYRGRVVFAGSSSLVVYAEASPVGREDPAFYAYLTYVHVDDEKERPSPHGLKIDETFDERELSHRNRVLLLKNR